MEESLPANDSVQKIKLENLVTSVPWNVCPRSCALRFNNVDRLGFMPAAYYSRYTKYETMKKMPTVYHQLKDPGLNELKSYYEKQRRLLNQSYYSFELDYNSKDPSGCCNFNRLDNATLRIDTGKLEYKQQFLHDSGIVYNYIRARGTYNVNIYSYRYNVVRVSKGQIGLAFE